MPKDFEEIDYRPTPLGDLVLQRRRIKMLEDLDVLEVKLGDEYLMSSLFHEVEVALADLGLADFHEPIDVVVGGLGLGYTAHAALNHPHLRTLTVIETLAPVIEWHQEGLVPLGPALTADPRCQFVLADFFALAADPNVGFLPDTPSDRVHAVLLDIDHSPSHWLHPRHAAFYEPAGLRLLAAHLHPGGIFALWSDAPPDEEFLTRLRDSFTDVEARTVSFPNPLQDRDSASTIYLARRLA